MGALTILEVCNAFRIGRKALGVDLRVRVPILEVAIPIHDQEVIHRKTPNLSMI